MFVLAVQSKFTQERHAGKLGWKEELKCVTALGSKKPKSKKHHVGEIELLTSTTLVSEGPLGNPRASGPLP